MRTAAAAWGGLGAELHSAATSYATVVSELTSGSWLGPASASMAAAAVPYVAWMRATAGQAEQAATQANAAAAAYEAAFTATVPPPVIAANRAQLMALLATNILGQNTPAIAATEAHYGEMWAQDATAMFGYAASSATAAELTPFTPPPQTTSPAGLAGQGDAVARASGSSAGTATQQALSQLTSAMPNALQALAAPTQATPAAPVSPLQVTPLQAPVPPELPPAILDILGVNTAAGTTLSGIGVGVSSAAWYFSSLDSAEILATQDEIADVQYNILNAIGQSGAPQSVGSAGLVAGGVPAPVSAAMGQAVPVGGLSVPSSWATAAPEIRTAAHALPTTSAGAAPAVSIGSPGTAFSQMALAGMGGSALAGTVSRGRPERVGATTCERAKALQKSPDGPITGIATELRELVALHDEGILTDEEFNEQKRRLLSR